MLLNYGAPEAAQGAPRDPRRDSRRERSPLFPLERTPDSWVAVNGNCTLMYVVLVLLRGSQAPRRAVCGTRGSLRTMHGGGSALRVVPSPTGFILVERGEDISRQVSPILLAH